MGLDLPFSTEDLTRLYRFALLLTGDDGAAQQVFYDACVDSATRLGSYSQRGGAGGMHDGTSVRRKAKTVRATAETMVEGRGIARAFATLPEDERVALAGLYTGLLPARGLAEALKISLEQLGRALKSARERLGRGGLELGKPSLEQAL